MLGNNVQTNGGFHERPGKEPSVPRVCLVFFSPVPDFIILKDNSLLKILCFQLFLFFCFFSLKYNVSRKFPRGLYFEPISFFFFFFLFKKLASIANNTLRKMWH